jgi:hypothetical protein
MPESVFIMRGLALTTALAFDQHFVQAGFVTPGCDCADWRSCGRDWFDETANGFFGSTIGEGFGIAPGAVASVESARAA